MKKILFTLVALVCSMGMNAQVMKIMKGDEVVATYSALKADKVVFEEASTAKHGKATRTGGIEVIWTQLWKDGPKFAAYNIGAETDRAWDYGNYFAWGGNQNIVDDHNTGLVALSGDSDTATKLWGSNWRMPTEKEFQGIIDNCDIATETINGVYGYTIKGRGDYAYEKIFLPAAGFCHSTYEGKGGQIAYYWTSTPTSASDTAWYLCLRPGERYTTNGYRRYFYPIRPVLDE